MIHRHKGVPKRLDPLPPEQLPPIVGRGKRSSVPTPPTYERLPEPERPGGVDPRDTRRRRNMALFGAGTAALGALANVPALGVVGASIARPAADSHVAANEDYARQMQAYYDRLTGVQRFNTQQSNRERDQQFALDRDLWQQEERRTDALTAHQRRLAEKEADANRPIDEATRALIDQRKASADASRALAEQRRRETGAGGRGSEKPPRTLREINDDLLVAAAELQAATRARDGAEPGEIDSIMASIGGGDYGRDLDTPYVRARTKYDRLVREANEARAYHGGNPGDPAARLRKAGTATSDAPDASDTSVPALAAEIRQHLEAGGDTVSVARQLSALLDSGDLTELQVASILDALGL